MTNSQDIEVQSETLALEVRPQEVTVPAQPTSLRAITPAQAKIDAIANLTMSAYSRAASLELTNEEIAKLQADFPDEAFQPGAGGKEHLIYIQHAWLRDRLNSVFRPGQWSIIPRNRWAEPFRSPKGTEGSRVYVEAMLVIRGAFVAEAVGEMEYYPSNASQNYGDAVEGAKTAALRRCCKELGVGLQAWKKEWCEGWWARKHGRRTEPQPQPPPASEPEPPPKPAAPFPTEQSRAKMIASLKAGPGEPNRETVTDYFRKLSDPAALMENEELESLELRFCPATTGQMNDLAEAIARFGSGDRAAWAYQPHIEPDPVKKTAPKAKAPKAANLEGTELFSGIIEHVSEKTGTGKRGPWTLYGVKIGETWLNTFDSKLGALAGDLKGRSVHVYGRKTDRGYNLTDLEEAPQP